MTCKGTALSLKAASVAAQIGGSRKRCARNMTANSAQFAAREIAIDDLDLVHASKKGDVAAFKQLAKRYSRRFLRISQGVTRHREDSEDAVQEVLLKAFQIWRLSEKTPNSQPG
jgi:hypothetical protein